ncbi:MAG: DUF4271 domain-containing protein [Bacteroidia bacterium]
MPQSVTDSSLLNSAAENVFYHTPAPDSVTPFKNANTLEFTSKENDTLSAVNIYSDTSSFSLFKEHRLKISEINPSSKTIRNPDWLIIVVILIISYLTWIRVFNYKIIKQHFSALFSNALTNQIVRDENLLVQRTSVLLSLIFYFSVALFLYQASVFFNWDYKLFNNGFPRYVIFILLFASAYSFKMILLKLMGVIFRIDRVASTYIFNIFLINNILGMVFIPLVILIALLTAGKINFLIWTGIGILLVAFLYRIFRGIIIWTSITRFSLYYLILYLCAFEIAPLLILFKLS